MGRVSGSLGLRGQHNSAEMNQTCETLTVEPAILLHVKLEFFNCCCNGTFFYQVDYSVKKVPFQMLSQLVAGLSVSHVKCIQVGL